MAVLRDVVRSLAPSAALDTVNPPGMEPGLARPLGGEARWKVPAICLALAALVWAVFGQALGFDFVNYDDNSYVYGNAMVLKGLSLQGLAWGFTHAQVGHWIPLTTWSHMLDCQLYGRWAGGHHLSNLLLHATTTVLLFLLGRRLTGALWPSAFVAAVWAIHPLRVESVVWVTERKDVLSGLFFMLTLWAYARYVRAAGAESGEQENRNGGKVKRVVEGATPSRILFLRSCFPDSRSAWLRYFAVLFVFALGLMAKGMLVTLPFVLLLLDGWPLGRFNRTVRWWRLLVEKAPFLALSLVAGIILIVVNREGTTPSDRFSPTLAANAIVAYVASLGQTVWPVNLAAFYPFPQLAHPLRQILPCLILLLAISAAAVTWRRALPSFWVGWGWYLGVFVPVIGNMQAGLIAHADRYTYLPHIGLWMAVTGVAVRLTAGFPHQRALLGSLGAGIIAAFAEVAHTQAGYWRESETLWKHALACTERNFVAHDSLSQVYFEQGRYDEAVEQSRLALAIQPDAESHVSMGNALLAKGRTDEAIAHYEKSFETRTDFAEAHSNLGNALFQKGRFDEAMGHYRAALKIHPDYVEAHNNLGFTLLHQGRLDEAITELQRAVELRPDYAQAQANLRGALAERQRRVSAAAGRSP